MAVVCTVKDLVNGQRSRLTESFVAVSTLVGLVFAVDVLVVPQVILSSERFTTHITGEWSLVGVGPLMDHDVVGLGELSVAIFADEPLLWSAGA